jgi:hypothetical protein
VIGNFTIDNAFFIDACLKSMKFSKPDGFLEQAFELK